MENSSSVDELEVLRVRISTAQLALTPYTLCPRTAQQAVQTVESVLQRRLPNEQIQRSTTRFEIAKYILSALQRIGGKGRRKQQGWPMLPLPLTSMDSQPIHP